MVGVPEPPGNRPIRQGLPSAQAQGVRPLAFSTSMLTSSSRFCEKKCAITHPERRGFYCPVCSIGYGSNWNHNGRATKEKTHHVCTGKGQQDQPFTWFQDHNAAGQCLNDLLMPMYAFAATSFGGTRKATFTLPCTQERPASQPTCF